MQIFWEMSSRVISAISAYLLDSGYMCGVSVRVLGVARVFYVKVYSDRLFARSHLPSPMRKWPRSSFTTVVLLVLLGTMPLALCLHFTLCSTRLSAGPWFLA